MRNPETTTRFKRCAGYRALLWILRTTLLGTRPKGAADLRASLSDSWWKLECGASPLKGNVGAIPAADSPKSGQPGLDFPVGPSTIVERICPHRSIASRTLGRLATRHEVTHRMRPMISVYYSSESKPPGLAHLLLAGSASPYHHNLPNEKAAQRGAYA
jgi:hypothetical protein